MAEMANLRGLEDRHSSKYNPLSEAHIRLARLVNNLQQRLSSTTKPRICLPDKWNGSNEKPDSLLATVDMIFQCQPSVYISSTPRVALLTSLLSRETQERTAVLYNQKAMLCNDYIQVVVELQKTFVPPCREVDVETKLLQLCQQNQHVHLFSAEFRTLAGKLAWGDSVLQSLFFKGHANYIWDEMVGREAPKRPSIWLSKSTVK